PELTPGSRTETKKHFTRAAKNKRRNPMNRNLLFTTSAKGLLALAAITAITAGTAAHAQPDQAPRYSLKDLGPSGNRFSQAAGVADNGLVAGLDTAPDGTSHS